jgi:hypothetical protein
MNYGKVVEDVMQECRKTFMRNDICVTQWSDEELSKEVRSTAKREEEPLTVSIVSRSLT